MVFWERRAGLLLVLAAVGVGVYGGVSAAVVWSMPLAFVLALVGIAALVRRREEPDPWAAEVDRQIAAGFDGIEFEWPTCGRPPMGQGRQ